MIELRTLLSRHAQDGRVAWIGIRPKRHDSMVPQSDVHVLQDGLSGDHARPGKRAVTLIQAEHLPVIAALIGRQDIAPDILRRNILVSGLNLSALRGAILSVGTARLRITTVCAPCSRMETALGHGGYNAMRGHGGWCAEVVAPGHLSLGDPVQVVEHAQ
ncbi:MOSC domain-containing protein [Marivita sp. S0852]|uniref:MOSC domain-containing protein n=1 Tax=Marivita sp. S0852 TaxID=3373893 RepID=UPI003981F323